MKSEIAFTGEVHPTTCLCHPGQFVVIVFQLHPLMGKVPIGSDMFKTEKEAEENLQSLVLKVSTAFVESLGLSVDQAREIKIAHGEQADKESARFQRQNNPNLH